MFLQEENMTYKKTPTPAVDQAKVKIERERSRNDILISASNFASALEELKVETTFKKMLDSSGLIGMAICDKDLRYKHTTKFWDEHFLQGVRPPYIPMTANRNVHNLIGIRGLEPIITCKGDKIFCYWERWEEDLAEGFVFYFLST